MIGLSARDEPTYYEPVGNSEGYIPLGALHTKQKIDLVR